MTCAQGEFETVTNFKDRFENKFKDYNAALGPNNIISDKRAAMTFLGILHKLQYDQFYAHMVNTINQDATQVPTSVNDVFQKAKAHVIIGQGTKQNGTPVAFATTAENYLKSNRKKTPRGNNKNTNNPNNGLYVPSTPATTTPSVSTAITEPTANDATSNATTARVDNTRDLSRVQCYNCQLFGHYARSRPSKGDDPLNAMTTNHRNYYHPKWYEVGLDTLSQINILNSRFLTDFVPGDSSFKGLGNQSRSTSYFGTLPVIPGLQYSVCDDCAALILSFALVKKAGVDNLL